MLVLIIIGLVIGGIVNIAFPEYSTTKTVRKRTPFWRKVEYDDADVERTIFYGKVMFVLAGILTVWAIISGIYGGSQFNKFTSRISNGEYQYIQLSSFGKKVTIRGNDPVIDILRESEVYIENQGDGGAFAGKFGDITMKFTDGTVYAGEYYNSQIKIEMLNKYYCFDCSEIINKID